MLPTVVKGFMLRLTDSSLGFPSRARLRVTSRHFGTRGPDGGGGPRKRFEWFPAQLQAEVKSLGLEERVTLCGYREDVADIMNAADIFVCVSESEEFNRVLVEAMAFGKPVIATDPIVVEHGVNGLLVRSRDVAGLKDALWKLRDRERRICLGDAARRYAFDRFSIENIIPKYQRVYLSLLKHTTVLT
jgi:glycosyltransferase involved in cell wall biosynthesis